MFLLLLFCTAGIRAVAQKDSIWSFRMNDVRITIDEPATHQKKAILILFALPNGNTTEQTMGKQLQPGDDWHFDIQHIRAQTKFIRLSMPSTRIMVAYLENNYKSWPLWKRNHPEFRELIPAITDSVRHLAGEKNVDVYLNGHSGGGSFIFGFLDSYSRIPSYIRRISFLDSNYGYDSTYMPKLVTWLKGHSKRALTVFAYNDSVALYNDKPVVSATGGTWHKTHKMLIDLSMHGYTFLEKGNDSVAIIHDRREQLWFFLKTNPDRKIFHTTQVELNGFIHSILCGTRLDSKGYRYYDKRAYQEMIEADVPISQK